MFTKNKTDKKFKFSIISRENGELYGHFSNITGLMGDKQVEIDGYIYHQIALEQCYPIGDLKEWCLNKRKWPHDLTHSVIEILMLNYKQEIIGSYGFLDSKPIQYRPCHPITDEFDIVMVGVLSPPALPHSLALWEHWRLGIQVNNIWANFSFEERRAWLQIVIKYHCSTYFKDIVCQDAPAGSCFDLDGTHITDYPSFFCAIGEAINGPGGYFGRSLDALNDCLCGGFGATVPFTLRWHQSHVARHYLDRAALLREWEARDCDDEFSCMLDENDEEIYDYESDGPSLFEIIMEVFTDDHSVNVELL